MLWKFGLSSMNKAQESMFAIKLLVTSKEEDICHCKANYVLWWFYQTNFEGYLKILIN